MFHIVLLVLFFRMTHIGQLSSLPYSLVAWASLNQTETKRTEQESKRVASI